MKILIIGGTGVLSGAVLKEALTHLDFTVTCINRGTKNLPNNVELIKADIKDKKNIVNLLNGRHFDCVLDFLCYNKSQLEYSFNLLYPYVDQYVFISTTCVYDTSILGIKNEDSPKVLKEWNYSKEKWECETFLMKEAIKKNIKYTIIRPAVTYDNTRIPYGIMPAYGYHWTLIGRILSGKPIITWNGGIARWNIMHVNDFAIGVVGLLGNKKAYNNVLNVCSDESYSWQEVLNIISEKLNCKINVINLTSNTYAELFPIRKGEIIARSYDSISDNTKLKSIVPEFSSKLSLKQGISNTIDYYKKNNYLKGIDYKFDGIQDRIIKKMGYKNVYFVDYLGNADFIHKIIYKSQLYYGTLYGTILSYILKIYNKLK